MMSMQFCGSRLACGLLALAMAATAFAADRAAPVDQPYPGILKLSLDLSDAPRKIFRVHETIPVRSEAAHGGKVDLYYPKWIPGEHGPSGPITNITGLKIRAGGQAVKWRRDLRDMYTLHLDVPQGASSLDLEFQFLSPTGGGQFGRSVSATPKLVAVEMNQVAFYPAGYYSRDIRIQPSIKFPHGWQYATAMRKTGGSGDSVQFKALGFNDLVDSPVIAGEYFKRVDLAPGAKVPVHLNLVADSPEQVQLSDAQITDHRHLVQQAYALFGAHHYSHYDFLFVLSDNTGHFGLEHHQSSDDRLPADFFTDDKSYKLGAGLLPHEYVHSWNGKFRRPADLWTRNFNQPMRDDLLWVYEGLTSYFGDVLTARSGLWTPDQYREALAASAASMQYRTGRAWRSLQDTADEAQVLYYSPRPWANWRRRTDFYAEGELLWLDVDTKLRELSHGKRSIDDFAHAFYGMDNGSYKTRTYTFDDLVATLNGVQAYDWAKFLHDRLDYVGDTMPEEGIARAGWKLVFNDTESQFQKDYENKRHVLDAMYSIGLSVTGKKGRIGDVLWNGPAFAAGLAPGMSIVAIDGKEYSSDALKHAIEDAADGKKPIELLVKNLAYYRTLKIDYHGGPKYPHLVREKSKPDRLADILKPRKP